MKPGPAPMCNCGTCRTCKRRAARRDYYARHSAAIIARNVETKRLRQQAPASDEDLDARSAAWLEDHA